MNLDKLFDWIVVLVISFALTGNLDKLTQWIYKTQVKVVYESRASAWGSPSIFNHRALKK